MENKEAQIIEELESHFKEIIDVEDLQVSVEPAVMANHPQLDFLFSIRSSNLSANFACEVFSAQSSSSFENSLFMLKSFGAQQDEYLPCIIARYLSAERRKKCREEGINFLDLSGNAYLKYKSLFIEREGFPNRFPEKRAGRNPFSDKASLILREALKHQHRLWGVREMAEAVKLDPGFVSRMLKELEKRRYIIKVDSKFRIEKPENILMDWVRSYDYKKNEESRFFCLAKNPDEILGRIRNLNIPTHVKYALGFQAGAGLVSPHARYQEVHIYVENEAGINFFKEALKLREAEDGANIIILLPYYRNSSFFDKQKVEELWVTSDLQLYLDLYKYPIRGLEQAEHLFKKRIKKLIEGKPSDVGS